MKKSDVVVIGGGLSGLFAACIAAEQGKKVQLLSYGAGTLTIGGGMIDALGYTDTGVPVANAWRAIEHMAKEHPYGKIGAAAVAEAFAAFQRITAAQGYEYLGNLAENQWLPTAVGTLKPTCLTPKTMDGTALRRAKDVLVVGFDLLKDFYVDMVWKNLRKCYDGAKQVDRVMIKLPFNAERDKRDISVMDVARWLETSEGQAEFIMQIKDQVKPDMAIVMPPVLGTTPDYRVLESLKIALGCHLIEVSAMPPAVTGYRLAKLLTAYANKLGVRIVNKAKVTGSRVVGGKCEYIIAEGCEREKKYYADTFILATGGIFGGGLMTAIGEMTEPVFDISLPVPEVQTEWSHKELFSAKKQIFAQYGVTVNGSLLPVAADGKVIAANVKVVGRTLAGYDYCFEKSGNGVALATAYQAAISLMGEVKK